MLVVASVLRPIWSPNASQAMEDFYVFGNGILENLFTHHQDPFVEFARTDDDPLNTRGVAVGFDLAAMADDEKEEMHEERL